MQTALSCLVNGTVLSSAYILVALGFALLLSIIGIFNFAHGVIYMLGAYVTYVLAVTLGFNQWASLIISIIVMGSFGLFMEKFFFRPFVGNPTKVIVLTVSLILIFETAINVTIGGVVRAIPPYVPGVFQAGHYSIGNERLVTVAISAVLLIATILLIQKAKIGQQMLAVAQDKEGSKLQGIDINRTAAIATVLGCGMAALAGSLMASIFSLSPFMGDTMLLKAIQVVILSGIGSVGGILVGGLIIGFLDGVLPVFMPAAIASSIAIGIVIVILLIRPKGLFGYELF